MVCEAWPVEWACDVTGVDEARLEMARALAADLLWAMSGYRLGVCTYDEAYRPTCGAGCVMPYRDAAGWHNGLVDGGTCCRILLDHRPVVAVAKVTEPGKILDPVEYALERGWLRKRNGCWTCGLSCDDPTVEVVYTAGAPLPASTALAVGEVGCEFLAALDGKPCKLPSRAVSVTRQGVTVELGSPNEFAEAGLLGLPVTDAWLNAAGRGGPKVASKVYSPDLLRPVASR